MSDRDEQQIELDIEARYARFQYQQTLARLAGEAQSLANDMHLLVEKVERLMAGDDATINSLGHVQGRGSSIDRLCGLLDEQRKYAVTLTRLAAYGQ